MHNETIDLAIHALEAERIRFAGAIAELRSSLNGHGIVRKAIVSAMAMPLVDPAKARVRMGKRRLTSAGRKALSDAARRRWARARAAGKRTL